MSEKGSCHIAKQTSGYHIWYSAALKRFLTGRAAFGNVLLHVCSLGALCLARGCASETCVGLGLEGHLVGRKSHDSALCCGESLVLAQIQK